MAAKRAKGAYTSRHKRPGLIDRLNPAKVIKARRKRKERECAERLARKYMQ